MVNSDVVIGRRVLFVLCPAALHLPVANVLPMESPDCIIGCFLGSAGAHRSSRQDLSLT